MKTRYTRSPRIAAEVLRGGGVVAFPTETVYGLGADALNASAVRAIFKAKGRPSDNPLIVHIGEPAQAGRVARRIPAAAEILMQHFFPGPLTVIVPRHRAIPREVTAGLDTVGIRCPVHPVAHAFLLACGTPVAAPSANRSGRPSPTTWHAVREEMDGRIPCMLQGGVAEVGLESTVVDCTRKRPVILREGAVSLEALQRVLPGISSSAPHETSAGAARSPGLKYRHYAPHAKVVLVDGPADVPPAEKGPRAYIGLNAQGFSARPERVAVCRDVQIYARKLFQFFRKCEKEGVKTIYCQRVPASGLGRALMDRMRRAAEPKKA